MFCPRCGNADQKENTYCRQCGSFLPDFNKLKRKEIPPEQHLKANTVLNIMTAVASLTLAVLLYTFFLGRDDTPILIYITAGFLTAMFFWQLQTIWRTSQLKKQFPKRKAETEDEIKTPDGNSLFEAAKTKELLKEADTSNAIPIDSVTENTTRNLKIR